MISKRNKAARKELKKDLLLILVGCILALVIVNSGVLKAILNLVGNPAAAAFLAGIFFTSAFTLVPASFALVSLTDLAPLHTIALLGALGAMVGDVIIFLFIRDRFADDLMNAMKPSVLRHVLNSFHLGFMKWLSPILGALIIASPLPDEFGLTLLGLSKTRLVVLMPIAFAMNWLGIYLVVWLAQAI